jgi:hypothetical protein
MTRRRKIVVPPGRSKTRSIAERQRELVARIADLKSARSLETDFTRRRRLRGQLTLARATLRKLESKMRRSEAAVAAVIAPNPGWRLICRRQFRTATELFNAGAEISPEALGRNFRAFLENRFVEWVPPGTPITVKAQKLAAPPPAAKPNPKVVIVHDADAVSSYRRTVKAVADAIDGDFARARILVQLDPLGSELYQRSQRIMGEIAERSRKPMETLL